MKPIASLTIGNPDLGVIELISKIHFGAQVNLAKEVGDRRRIDAPG